MPTSLKASALLAYGGSVCFVLSGLCFLGGLGAERSVVTWESNLNVQNHTDLVHLWEGRRAGRPGFLAGDAFEVLGWLFIIPPITATATILGGPQRSATSLLSACFVTTAIVNMVGFTFQMGAVTVTDSWSVFVSTMPAAADGDDLSDLPYLVPLQNLEVMYRMSRSRTLWLVALDMLFLTIGFSTAAFLVSGTRVLAPAWRNLTIVLTVLTFCGFWAGIGSAIEYGDSTFGVLRPVSGLYFLFITAVCLPTWLVWLGRQLAENDGKEFGAFQAYVSKPGETATEMADASKVPL